LGGLNARAAREGVEGHREFHTGWHAALDLRNLLTVSEAIARSALERRESRGGHFRDDYPDKVAEFGTSNVAVRRGASGAMEVARRSIPDMPAELKQVIEDQKQ
jgi:succinate dehydrogenase / fumarate reductase flavoprotein subunit